MSVDYKVQKRFSDALVGIVRGNERALWSRGKARKRDLCRICRKAIETGAQSFRPVGNQLYRRERLCAPCVERAG